ncbi:ABC transporter substrate-binding protein [Kribbella speibonae]|uniref:ABC transporter substrate-binding protein n=1 Tax=Kribbella speibonae TaxID=1572660 RepID=A0A4R0IXN2_9ACTN|nr:ABC transporter substrate-binding protein [Kribbella speibonae]TCC36446.1 ABC transporter substrate-binding protein [Kribbella speibonae]
MTRRGFIGLGALAAASIPVLSACTGSSSPGAQRASGPPKKGGVLKLGMLGGGSSETLDPTRPLNNIDSSRSGQIYDLAYSQDPEGRTIPWLIQEATPGATAWKLRVRDGVTFHDGRPLTAADLAWSYNWALNASNGSYGRGALLSGRVKSVRALDKTTVLIELSQPNFLLDQTLSTFSLAIFPNGTHPGAGGKFIGTGPFKLDRFAAGQRAVFSANPNYWGGSGDFVSEGPYLDGLQIVSITDADALANAVRSGQVDAVTGIAFEHLAAFQQTPEFTVYNSPSGNCNVHAMDTQAAPYNDPRVRKALRLLVDREQQVSNGVSGQGKVANDLFAWFDPYYAADLPQISYDPDQAKSLLKAAGMETATFELNSTSATPGVLASANLLAESAGRAGVNVKVKQVPYESYFSTTYLKKPFFGSQWALGLTQTWNNALTSDAPYPETRWKNAQWSSLYNQALASSDEARRKSLLADAQKILHDEGGYIIPVFTNHSDVARSKVAGLVKSAPFAGALSDFRGAWIE